MNSTRMAVSVVMALSASLAGAPSQAASAIVGAWLETDASELGVVTFLDDGHYIDTRVVDGDPAHTGLEWGTYSWNVGTGKITASALGDLNGDWGVAGDVDGPVFASVTGNTATATQPGCAGCTTVFTRVLPAASPIVGTWLASSGASFVITTFLADGRYLHGSFHAGDATHSGLEWGTYSWDQATGKITASAVGDQNGDWGIAGDVDGPQYMLVNQNTGTFFQPGCDDCGGQAMRVLPAVPEPNEAAMALAGAAIVAMVLAARRRGLG